MMFNLSVRHEVKLARPQRGKTESELREWQNQTTQLLHRIPGPVKYPIRWTSERQRRYYFAEIAKYDSKGNVIPTKRTGRVSQWGVFVDYPEITKIQDFTAGLFNFVAKLNPFKREPVPKVPSGGIIIAMTNEVPYQQYVTGVRQQGFHADTGWIHAPTVTVVQLKKAEGIIEGL